MRLLNSVSDLWMPGVSINMICASAVVRTPCTRRPSRLRLMGRDRHFLADQCIQQASTSQRWAALRSRRSRADAVRSRRAPLTGEALSTREMRTSSTRRPLAARTSNRTHRAPPISPTFGTCPSHSADQPTEGCRFGVLLRTEVQQVLQTVEIEAARRHETWLPTPAARRAPVHARRGSHRESLRPNPPS